MTSLIFFAVLLVFLCGRVSAQVNPAKAAAQAAQNFTVQTNLPPYNGTQYPAQNLIPFIEFPVDFWTWFTGDEATAAKTVGMNFRYSGRRSHGLNPSNCAAPVTLGPLPGAKGNSFDELFGFDLQFTFDPTSVKATNVKLDLNIDSTPTTSTADRGIVVALIDKGALSFVAFERSGFQGSQNPLGRVLYGSTSSDFTTLLTPTQVSSSQAHPCKCGNVTSSCDASYCPETVQSWNTYFSIEPLGGSHVSVAAFSSLWDQNQGIVVNTSGLRGPFRIGVYASSAESTHNLHGMWIQVRKELYQIRSRIFSSIYTGTQLRLWVSQFLDRGQNPFVVPVTRGPYTVPYMSTSPSSNSTCFPDRWEFAATTTTINQGTPPQWSGGVRSTNEQEFEQLWYFPMVGSGAFNDSRDILVQLNVVSSPLNPSADNRVLVGVTDASVSLTTAGRFFGFTRGTPQDKRLGWIVDGQQLVGTNGFLYYDPDLGSNIFQGSDLLGRVNLYLVRGSSNVPSYLEIPYDDESAGTIQGAYGTSGQVATSFSFKLIQSRTTVPPGQSYVFMEARTLSDSAGTFLDQAFLSGGSTIDTSGRRLDGSQVLAINAFQFIGKTRSTQAETELVTPPGQNSGFSMIAFSLDLVNMSCMRREGEPEQYDKCEVCNGNNSCVDCQGVPYGTSRLDRCNVCNGNNSCSFTGSSGTASTSTTRSTTGTTASTTASTTGTTASTTGTTASTTGTTASTTGTTASTTGTTASTTGTTASTTGTTASTTGTTASTTGTTASTTGTTASTTGTTASTTGTTASTTGTTASTTGTTASTTGTTASTTGTTASTTGTTTSTSGTTASTSGTTASTTGTTSSTTGTTASTTGTTASTTGTTASTTGTTASTTGTTASTTGTTASTTGTASTSGTTASTSGTTASTTGTTASTTGTTASTTGITAGTTASTTGTTASTTGTTASTTGITASTTGTTASTTGTTASITGTTASTTGTTASTTGTTASTTGTTASTTGARASTGSTGTTRTTGSSGTSTSTTGITASTGSTGTTRTTGSITSGVPTTGSSRTTGRTTGTTATTGTTGTTASTGTTGTTASSGTTGSTATTGTTGTTASTGSTGSTGTTGSSGMVPSVRIDTQQSCVNQSLVMNFSTPFAGSWVGLFSDHRSDYLDWRWVSGQGTLVFHLPSVPGPYSFILFSDASEDSPVSTSAKISC